LFLKSLTVTATYVIMAAPLQVAAALTIAMMLNNKKMAAVGVWRTLYYMPSIVSGIAVSLLWMWILNPDFGLLNYLLGLIGIAGPRWVYSEQWAIPSFVMIGVWAAGSNMLLYLAGLQSIPTPSMKLPPSTAPVAGGASGTSPSRCSARPSSSTW